MGDKSKGRLTENLFGASTISRKVFGENSSITNLLARGEDPLAIGRGARRERKDVEAAQRKQAEGIKRQKLKETARLAEEENEIGLRRAMSRPGRGSLLTATSPTGTKALTLGGA